MLSIVLTTRDRPELLRRTVCCTLANMAREDTKLLIAADEDDLSTLAVLGKLPQDGRILISVEPREDTRGEKCDRVLTAAPADVYLHMADYSPVLTWGFDQKILDAAGIWPDGIGVVYTKMCDELVPMLQAPTHKYCELIGYTYNHDYPFWFIDHEMADIAWQIGRINFAEVECDLSQRPEKTTRLRDLDFWTHYYDFTADERQIKVETLLGAMTAPDWLKDQLKSWRPLLEMRSRARNSRVRMGAKSCEEQRGNDGEPDEGYLRARAKAEKKLTAILKEKFPNLPPGHAPVQG